MTTIAATVRERERRLALYDTALLERPIAGDIGPTIRVTREGMDISVRELGHAAHIRASRLEAIEDGTTEATESEYAWIFMELGVLFTERVNEATLSANA